jgi:UDP-3-O-[3-hydroxymyristoyl] N-acetylglucosamine deacetylase/3-hydroxyacyl-[acyl-carrier-protein] dehydratase
MSQSYYDQMADMMKVQKRDAKHLGYIMNKPLRFSNEPARHKLLDILGDISLIGKFIKGTIISVRTGHKANNMFARAILEDLKKT